MRYTVQQIAEIWIEGECWEEWSAEDSNTDVFVTCKDQTQFVASFFTLKNIQQCQRNWQKSGECLHGKYFWASDMVIIDRCTREDIEIVKR